VTSDRTHRALLLASAVAALVCVAELFWLRSAKLQVTSLTIGLLFLPWAAAAAANLAVWYSTATRGPPTRFNRLSLALCRIVAGGFAIAFLVLYGSLLLRS
jgi:hypothetical protein